MHPTKPLSARPSEFNRFQERKHLAARFVDFLNKHQDHECALLGAMGYATRFIAHETGLSEGQVNYRLSKANISRGQFRQGQGEFAKLLIDRSRDAIDQRLYHYLAEQSAVTDAQIQRLQNRLEHAA